MRMRWKKLLRISLLFLSLSAIIWSGSPSFASQGSENPFVLVIDPGHGGLDGGAVSADGGTESRLNLEIALRLRDLCRLCGVRCLMTRTEESLPYPPDLTSVHAKKVWDQQRRVELIHSQENPVLISIHQNYYPDARPRGTQVLYARSPESETLGRITHENLICALCPENRRVAAPASDSIYLMKQVTCPGILVECGFLSNPDETHKLKSERYQKQLAAILAASFLQYTNANESRQ